MNNPNNNGNRPGGRKPNTPPMKGMGFGLYFILLLILLGTIGMFLDFPKEGEAVAYSDVIAHFENEEVKAFVKEFMKAGNFEAQFNVVDQDTLLDAIEHPERHRTLLVRVAGYSDYFVDLSPIIQREILSRLEHGEF